jgi:hypothetical protein
MCHASSAYVLYVPALDLGMVNLAGRTASSSHLETRLRGTLKYTPAGRMRPGEIWAILINNELPGVAKEPETLHRRLTERRVEGAG